MAKVDAEALNKLLDLANKGQVIQIEQTHFGYEVTVWPIRNHDPLNHHHYQGDTLIETILKIKC